MFPISNILAALPWRLIVAGVAASALFIGGCQYGENRVIARWNVEKAATAQAVSKQAEHVAAVNAQESNINQEISNDYRNITAAIAADRHHLLARVPQRVRIDTPAGSGAVSGIPTATGGTDATATDAVPITEKPATSTSCERLAEDAAQTTLMVVEFQRWYEEQAQANH